jgi:hypothetical protein
MLAAIAGERDEGLVEAQGVELEAVVAEDPDAVEVALGDVLEGAGLDAEAGDELVAVEGALAQALALEVVGDLLDRGGGLGEGEAGPVVHGAAGGALPSPVLAGRRGAGQAATLAEVPRGEAAEAQAEVDLGEGALVGVAAGVGAAIAEQVGAEEAGPQCGGDLVLVGALGLDGLMHGHAAEGEPGGGGPVLAGAREVDAVEPDVAQGVGLAGAGGCDLRLEDLGAGQFAGAEVGEAGHGLAPLAAGAQRLGEGPQPLLVLEVDALDDLDQLAQVDLGVGVSAGAQRALGADPQDVGVHHGVDLAFGSGECAAIIAASGAAGDLVFWPGLARWPRERLAKWSDSTSLMIWRARWARRPWLRA